MANEISRRDLINGATIGAIAISTNAGVKEMASANIFDNRPILAMLCYPGMFPMDLVGPEGVFSGMGTHRVALVWKDKNIVKSDSGLGIAPNMTFAEAPENIDIIFIPGGALGTLKCMEDKEVIDFVSSRAKNAKYITSVCTGSLILGAAGLLKGYKATSHWAARAHLAKLGAIPTDARVVEDRNRITGGGVTSGIDMALTLAARLAGETRAKAIQLNIEYDPNPPFDSGSPEKAGKELTEILLKSYTPFTNKIEKIIPEIATKINL